MPTWGVSRLSKGVKYMLISTLCFSAMQSLVKFTPDIPILEHIFFRSLIGWLLCVGFLKNYNIPLRGKNNKMLVFRGLIGSTTMFSFFYLLNKIPFGTAVAFKYLSPVFTTVLAIIILKEKIPLRKWAYLFMSFIGILIIKGFDPRIGYFDLALGLLSAITGGLLFIIIRKIGDDDHHLVILHYFMMISTALSFIFGFQDFIMPNTYQICIILIIGLVGFTAQNFFTISIQQKDNVSFLSVLRYTEAIYALIIGYLIFNESYTLITIMGMMLILLGVIMNIIDNPKIQEPKNQSII